MVRYLVLLLFLAGCPDPFDPGIEVDTNELKPYQAEAEQLAMDWFGVYPDTNIHWTTTLCPGDDSGLTAVVYNGGCSAGATFNCDHIYVADRGALSNSALIHELGHCFRTHQGLLIDVNHEVTTWWRTVEEINAEVKANGW